MQALFERLREWICPGVSVSWMIYYLGSGRTRILEFPLKFNQLRTSQSMDKKKLISISKGQDDSRTRQVKAKKMHHP